VDLAHGQISYKRSDNMAISEAVYAGQATVAVVHCSTCHVTEGDADPHKTGGDYVPGSFELRVPTESDGYAIIEKSATLGMSTGTATENYGTGHACMWCHKSRKDVTNYVLATTSITSTHWGPHDGPHADIYTGEGGYNYPGKTYRNSSHTGFEKGCVNCHMPAIAANMGVANHSFYPQLSVCTGTCHSNAENFDVNGGQSETKVGIQRLRETLNTQGYLTREGNTAGLTPEDLEDEEFRIDESRPQSMGVPQATAGAIYNYLLIARGAALGVHNPSYTNQLIYDSIQAVGGDLTGIVRPP
jgi:hypothetical protein